MTTLQKIDNQTLTQIIELCFDLSTDGGTPIKFRKTFLDSGKKLRSRLVKTLASKFNDDAPQFIKTSAELKAVNESLKETANKLTKFTETTEQIGKFVGILDDLLKIAASAI